MTSLESPNLDQPVLKGDLLYVGTRGVCAKALLHVGLFEDDPRLRGTEEVERDSRH